MMRKVFAVVLVILLFFATALSAHALTDSQRWKMEYQIQNLPEEYLELYAILPEGAYHSQKIVTVHNVKYGDWGMGPEGVLIQELIDNGVLVPPKEPAKAWGWENNPDVIYIPASEVRKIYEQTFGSGTFEDFKYQDYFSNYSEHFRYESATDCYAYLRWSGGGGVDSASAYASFVKAEKIQDGVELYIRYCGYQSASVSGDGVFKMYRDSQMRVSGTATPYYTSLTWAEEDFLREGKIDEYLALYKHTFRNNGVGGYYWVSTEMVQPENAERIGEFFEQQKNSVSTSTNQSSHTTDSSSETISERKPESPAMFPGAVWVCVGMAILSLFFIVVPVISKKK